MKSFFIKYWILLSIAAVVVVGGLSIWYLNSNTAPSLGTTTVTKGNVVASVNEPATVLAQNNVTLSFQEGGSIAHVYVSEGATVAGGTLLADLDASALQTGVEQANAALAAAQAQLDQLASGTRPQQLQIDEGVVSNAQDSLAVAIQSAFTAADDAVTNQTDNLFTSPNTNAPIFLVPVTNSQLAINIPNARVMIGGVIQNWYATINATSSNPNKEAALQSIADSGLSQVQSYLDMLAQAVNDAIPSSAMPQATLNGYKVDIATARTEVTAAVNGLTAAETAVTNAENQLTLAQAGSTPQQIQAQQAAVLQAQAALATAQLAVQHSSLSAPFGGTVNNLIAKVGQVVSPGQPMLSIVNNNGLKIQAYVPETDIANMKEGDPATVTLDAYGTGQSFPATVTTIDNSETQVNGTPAYQVTLYFKGDTAGFKDGMTGNVNIVTAEHDNVLEVPSRLIVANNNQSFVLVKNGNQTTEQPVQTGITGDNGMTEITSGLTAGETITNF